MNQNYKGVVVCGTDTDIGKTIVSAWLVLGLNGIYWKPIQSGLNDGSDSQKVSQILNLPEYRLIPEIYKFQAPVSPHWAAEKENKLIDPSLITPPSLSNPLIIETAGGLMVPINRNFLQINLIKQWKLPIVLVAKSSLGTLNHTLLSIEALKKRSIPIFGIILNGPPHEDNPRTLEQIGKVPILATLPPLKELTEQALAKEWDKQNLDNIFQDFKKNNF